MDQRMFKFRWKQKYQLYLKTWMRKSESTRQYVFLKQSSASDPLETPKEHGGCGSLMYNCHLMSLKSSPGDLNDNMRASTDSQKFPHCRLKGCHSKVCTDLCWFTGAAWFWLCWGRAGWNRYIPAWLWEQKDKDIEMEVQTKQTKTLWHGSVASWECLQHLPVGKTGK